jgi:hypothetical protein
LQNWVRFSALPGSLAADAVGHQPMSCGASIEYSWINRSRQFRNHYPEEEFRQQGFDPAIFRNINTPEDYRSL